MKAGFRRQDVDLLTLMLSPAYVIPLATSYGDGDPILGAERAYRHVRGMVLSVLRMRARHRSVQIAALPLHERLHTRSLDTRYRRSLLETLWYGFRVQALVAHPMSHWRTIAQHCWRGATPISSPCTIEVGDVSPQTVGIAVVRCAAEMLDAEPRLNLALLQGGVWQRMTPEVMVHTGIARSEIRPIVLSPLRSSHREVMRDLVLERIKGAEALEHEYAGAGTALMCQWLDAGFIVSPAGAMVSLCGSFTDDRDRTPVEGLEEPEPALIPGNGVPLAIGVGKLQGGKVVLKITVDHRVLDAPTGALAHAYLRRRLPEMCR